MFGSTGKILTSKPAARDDYTNKNLIPRFRYELDPTASSEVQPLFRPEPYQGKVYVSPLGLPSEGAPIEQISQEELKNLIAPELREFHWTDEPYVSDQFFADVSKESLKEFAKENGLNLINPDDLMLVNMKELGFATAARNVIPKGSILMMGGVITNENNLSPVKQVANDPFVIGGRQKTDPKKTFFSSNIFYRSFASTSQHIKKDSRDRHQFNSREETATENCEIIQLMKGNTLFNALKTTVDVRAGDLLLWDYGDDYFQISRIEEKSFNRQGGNIKTARSIHKSDYMKIATYADLTTIPNKEVLHAFEVDNIPKRLQNNDKEIFNMLTNPQRQNLLRYLKILKPEGSASPDRAINHISLLEKDLPNYFNSFPYSVLPPLTKSNYIMIGKDLPQDFDPNITKAEGFFQLGLDHFKQTKFAEAIRFWQKALYEYFRNLYMLVPENEQPEKEVSYKNQRILLVKHDFMVRIATVTWNLSSAYLALSKATPDDDPEKIQLLSYTSYFTGLRLLLREKCDLNGVVSKGNMYEEISIEKLTTRTNEVSKLAKENSVEKNTESHLSVSICVITSIVNTQ